MKTKSIQMKTAEIVPVIADQPNPLSIDKLDQFLTVQSSKHSHFEQAGQ